MWRRGVEVIATAQFHSTKPELTFRAGSKSAHGVSEIRMAMVPVGNKAKRFLLVHHATVQFIIIILPPKRFLTQAKFEKNLMIQFQENSGEMNEWTDRPFQLLMGIQK